MEVGHTLISPQQAFCDFDMDRVEDAGACRKKHLK